MNQPSSRRSGFPHSLSKIIKGFLAAKKDPAHVYGILAAVTLIGMVLRLWKMNEPVAYDEAYTFVYFATRPFRQILTDYSAPNNHILHTILVGLSYQLFGAHPWIVRLPAFLAGSLCIPVGFLATRRIFNANQALAAATLIALTPWFVSYSANGRGYTLLTLFALLLLNFAGIMVGQQNRRALIAYGLTAVLGFYTVPIFLYPMAGISLWVLATYLTDRDSWTNKNRRIWIFLLTCALAVVGALLLYSPVIFFGTGAGSLLRNEIVAARDWNTFLIDTRRRALKTWEDWMLNIALPVQYGLSAGFLISVFFYRRVSQQRVPLQLAMASAIAVLLVLQRVAPFPRVWLFLEIFYMLFAAAGLVWLAETFTRRAPSITKVIPAVILLIALAALTDAYFHARPESIAAGMDFPEEHAAQFLSAHLEDGDAIFAIAPVDMQTAYYLYMDGVPYRVFYHRDRPPPVENAVIVLRKNTEYNTPESVLQFYHLTSRFDLPSAVLLYQYGPLNVFSVPALR